MAGYLVQNPSTPFSFVIILNGRAQSYRARERIFALIMENLF